MALPYYAAALEPGAAQLTAPRARRCTFRRISRISAGAGTSYEVGCLYPDRRLPLPLGDLETSIAVCATCAAAHIFRPDED